MNLKVFLYIIAIFILAEISISAKEQFPPEGSNIVEMVELQNEINRHIKLLDSEKWEERKQAQKKLFDFIEKSKYTFNYFLRETYNSKSPEIKFSSKEILKNYFMKNIHDPDRKKGFIGISMGQRGGMIIEKKRYHPISVMSTIAGFPAEKAGIKANDMIIKVDNNVCLDQFNLNAFTTYIAAKKPGEKVSLTLFSGGKVVAKEITLGERPEGQPSIVPQKSTKQLFTEWHKLKIHEISK